MVHGAINLMPAQLCERFHYIVCQGRSEIENPAENPLINSHKGITREDVLGDAAEYPDEDSAYAQAYGEVQSQV